MNILIAPDSFKGSLSSFEVVKILKSKLSNSNLNLKIICQELADGGEGSIDVFRNFKELQKINLKVLNPHSEVIQSHYLFDNENLCAYIELAKASGIALAKNNFDILSASSIGTGQLIKDAIARKAKSIILFLGGSATNDAGIGILDSLGMEFYDRNNNLLTASTKNINKISRIDDTNLITKNNNISFTLAVDVNNFFYGENGATKVYASQKGANEEQILFLETSLRKLSECINQKYGVDIQVVPGSGAAGGIAGTLFAILNAKIVSASDIIFKKVNLKNKVSEADIIITGEGKIDNQTLNDKLIKKLSDLCKMQNKSLWAICGYFDGNEKLKEKLNIDNVYSLAKRKFEVKDSIYNAREKLDLLGNELIKDLRQIVKEKSS